MLKKVLLTVVLVNVSNAYQNTYTSSAINGSNSYKNSGELLVDTTKNTSSTTKLKNAPLLPPIIKIRYNDIYYTKREPKIIYKEKIKYRDVKVVKYKDCN